MVLPMSVPRRPAPGFTLVELLLALALGLTVVALASSAMLLARQSMLLVDQSIQLQDRERLARDVLTRLLRQAGRGTTLAAQEPVVFGWDNAVYRKPEQLDFASVGNIRNGNRPARCGTTRDSSCVNGSDIVLVQSASTAGATHCGGGTPPARTMHILYVSRSSTSAEPGLSCAYRSQNDWVSVPLIEGVESLQLLYGLQAQDARFTHIAQWQHAAQLEVAGDAAATRANWQRVRAVRIALVLRSLDGVAARAPSAVYPFGPAHADLLPTDVGATLALAPDQRLRRTVQWTVHLPAAGGQP